MKIKYSPESINDLERLVNFVENKNPLAARRIAIDLLEAMQKIKQFPQIGLPVSSAKSRNQIRDLYIQKYTVRYLITNTVVYILRVWHNKENEKNTI